LVSQRKCLLQQKDLYYFVLYIENAALISDNTDTVSNQSRKVRSFPSNRSTR